MIRYAQEPYRERAHWLHAAHITEHYTQTLTYHLAFADLYGGLCADAIRAGDDQAAYDFAGKAAPHANIHLYILEADAAPLADPPAFTLTAQVSTAPTAYQPALFNGPNTSI